MASAVQSTGRLPTVSQLRHPWGRHRLAGSSDAAIRYQHASADRDAVIAAALSGLVKPALVVPLEAVSGADDSPATNDRLTGSDEAARKGR